MKVAPVILGERQNSVRSGRQTTLQCYIEVVVKAVGFTAFKVLLPVR